MASPTLTQRLKDFANKISGVSTVDNMANPNSAAYKMQQSVGKPNPNAPKKKPVVQPNFKNVMTPNQQTYGVPGAQ